MVTGLVVVKKPFRPGRFFLWMFLIALAVGIVYIAFFLGAVFGKGPSKATVTYENPLTLFLEQYAAAGIEINQDELIAQAELEFNEDYLNYALFAMSAWKLHNPPFSSNTPKIRILLDSEDTYSSEVIDGTIITYGQNIENPDILITSTKKEIVSAMLAPDMAEFMKNSVAEGRIGIEMLASYAKLASKGYLQMYKDVTGESLIGSVIKK